jgi:hypothetical protein
MEKLTKQQQLIIEELKLLIALHINRLQQLGMTEEDATEQTYREINYLLKE